jgi:glucosamine-6-phosphate deaminase
MKLQVYKDYDEMSRAAAALVVNAVKQAPDALLCFPSGDTPTGVFNYLVKYARTGEVDFSRCHFVGLDEWVGMGKDDEGSCTYSLYQSFFGPLKIDPARVFFFDARAADLDSSCMAMDNFIKEHGPLAVMMVGVGMNGHIGLNEPGTDFNLYAHYAPLAQTTIDVGQKYFKQTTRLEKGITLGLKHLREAKISLLIASGTKKAGIIAQALEEKVTEQLPASIFQMLDNGYVLLDSEAASQLSAHIPFR